MEYRPHTPQTENHNNAQGGHRKPGFLTKINYSLGCYLKMFTNFSGTVVQPSTNLLVIQYAFLSGPTLSVTPDD